MSHVACKALSHLQSKPNLFICIMKTNFNPNCAGILNFARVQGGGANSTHTLEKQRISVGEQNNILFETSIPIFSWRNSHQKKFKQNWQFLIGLIKIGQKYHLTRSEICLEFFDRLLIKGYKTSLFALMK